jgi:hypothetical protein
MRYAQTTLIGKCEGRNHRPRHRWEDHAKIDLKEMKY